MLENKKMVLAISITSLIIFSIPVAFANPTIEIHSEKQIYSYGDNLSFTIQVSEVTGESAILYIIDANGIKSSPIPLPITQIESSFPSPYPFESTVYPLGGYTLEVHYSNNIASTEFELIDSGQVVIPMWIKEFSKYWYNGAISDREFSHGFEFLIKEGIIVVPQIQSEGVESEIQIPQWVKVSTGWWIDGLISDSEFASSIEFLIKAGIIVI